MNHPRKFRLNIYVHPQDQRQGIGSLLFDQLARELRPFEPVAYQARAYEDDVHTVRFLARRGFVEDFRQWESHLDTAAFDAERWRSIEEGIRARGIAIATLAELADDAGRDRRLYDLELETSADIPSPDSVRNSLWPRDEHRFHRYVDLVLRDPDRAPWTYLVAVKEGEYIGLSYGTEEPAAGSFDIDFTGVKRAYRGLGLATALKVRGIELARARGYGTVRTWNDTANAPILALNDRLGFVRQPSLIFFDKALVEGGQSTPSG
jgi:GNAT superfamily N-acetyltransferase